MTKPGSLVKLLLASALGASTLTLGLLVPASADSFSVRLGETDSVSTQLLTSFSATQFAILPDYPGRQRTLTAEQKREIRALIDNSKENSRFVCTGLGLVTNPSGMNAAIRERTKLVCDYAKSLRPDMTYWQQTTHTQSANHNGRVVVFSR